MRICGLDEVGRGALAGPLVAAGVCLPDLDIQLNDSKRLSRRKRELLFQEILNLEAEIVIEVITVSQINRHGIGWANVEIFQRIFKKIEADKYIVDGNLKIRNNALNEKVECLVRADQSIKSVMAASIVAKVTRDRMMQDLHRKFPEYSWNKNCGYGTESHINAVLKHGPSRHHRELFISTAVKNAMVKNLLVEPNITNLSQVKTKYESLKCK